MNSKYFALLIFILGCSVGGQTGLQISIRQRSSDSIEVNCNVRNLSKSPIFVEREFSDRSVAIKADTLLVSFMGLSKEVIPNQFLAPGLIEIGPGEILNKKFTVGFPTGKLDYRVLQLQFLGHTKKYSEHVNWEEYKRHLDKFTFVLSASAHLQD